MPSLFALCWPGRCFDATNKMNIMVKPCDGSAAQKFVNNSNAKLEQGGLCLDLWNFNGPELDM
jgi:hypothetical protein